MSIYKIYILFIIIFTGVINFTVADDRNFSGERAFVWLKKQTDLGPRNPGSNGHQACREMLTDALRNCGASVVSQHFMYYDVKKDLTYTMTNIIGEFNSENSPRIMLCAHWDTRPIADRDIPQNQNVPIPGANDGASGVAVLLEIARQLKLSPPETGVDIIFFDGEDYGDEGDLDNYCLGSRHFVQNNNRFFPRFAILLDMIGDAQLRIPMEGYSYRYAPQIVDMVWNTALDLGIHQFAHEIDGYVFDDHVILNEAGIPAINIIDFHYPDESHRYWHTLQDTPDKCSPESLKAVGDVLMNVIYNFRP